MTRSLQAAFEQRIVRLERAVRILGGTVICFAVLALIAARPSTPVHDLVQAERVQIVDQAGSVRLDLRHDSTETGLFVLDENGDTRLGAAQFAHGGGGFALHGPNMKGTAVLYLKEYGTLTFYDSTGVVVAQFPGR